MIENNKIGGIASAFPYTDTYNSMEIILWRSILLVSFGEVMLKFVSPHVSGPRLSKADICRYSEIKTSPSGSVRPVDLRVKQIEHDKRRTRTRRTMTKRKLERKKNKNKKN